MKRLAMLPWKNMGVSSTSHFHNLILLRWLLCLGGRRLIKVKLRRFPLRPQ
uniref:Uncharacterized protein n=1 Tax=Arundo donax TaxID=35708 RepID=A0A0A9BMN2_ARUDO